MSCDYNPYTLPTIDFVGGSTQDFVFHSFFLADKRPYDLSGCTAKFSIVNYTNQNGSPILSEPMEIASGDSYGDVAVSNLLKITLPPNKTCELHGKYIYQITIKESESQVDIPNQGILYITNNIDKGYITG